jgi:hypothetical protein
MRQLVGTWQLVTWTARTESGAVQLPFGERPLGVLVITADGWLSVHMSTQDRPPFKTFPIGEPAEQAAAFAGYLGYAGPCRIEGNQLVTTVVVSSHPNLLGTEQARDLELTDDHVVLRATVLTDARNELHWRRVSRPVDTQAETGGS